MIAMCIIEIESLREVDIWALMANGDIRRIGYKHRQGLTVWYYYYDSAVEYISRRTPGYYLMPAKGYISDQIKPMLTDWKKGVTLESWSGPICDVPGYGSCCLIYCDGIWWFKPLPSRN